MYVGTSFIRVTYILTFFYRNIEYFNEAGSEAKPGEGELTQDGDEPLLTEVDQQSFGSGHAETNDSIISFESPVEKQNSVIILPNSTLAEEVPEEEKIDQSPPELGWSYDIFLVFISALYKIYERIIWLKYNYFLEIIEPKRVFSLF